MNAPSVAGLTESRRAANSSTRQPSQNRAMFRSRIFGGALCRDDSIDPTHDVPKGNVRIITSLDLSSLTVVIRAQHNGNLAHRTLFIRDVYDRIGAVTFATHTKFNVFRIFNITQTYTRCLYKWSDYGTFGLPVCIDLGLSVLVQSLERIRCVRYRTRQRKSTNIRIRGFSQRARERGHNACVCVSAYFCAPQSLTFWPYWLSRNVVVSPSEFMGNCLLRRLHYRTMARCNSHSKAEPATKTNATRREHRPEMENGKANINIVAIESSRGLATSFFVSLSTIVVCVL